MVIRAVSRSNSFSKIIYLGISLVRRLRIPLTFLFCFQQLQRQRLDSLKDFSVTLGSPRVLNVWLMVFNATFSNFAIFFLGICRCMYLLGEFVVRHQSTSIVINLVFTFSTSKILMKSRPGSVLYFNSLSFFLSISHQSIQVFNRSTMMVIFARSSSN